MTASFVIQLTPETFVIKLDDINYQIYTRGRTVDHKLDKEHAQLASTKIFTLEKPLVYFKQGNFFMNKIYPHVSFYNSCRKRIFNQNFGIMCMGEDTRYVCSRLATRKNFDSLKIKLEERLTTATTNDSYVNYAYYSFDETNITYCKLCGCYIPKSDKVICGGCIDRCYHQIGEVTEQNVNSIKQCDRCGYYLYRFQKQCKSDLCVRRY